MPEVLSSRFEDLGTTLEREARLSGAVALARLCVVHMDFSMRAVTAFSDPAGVLGFSASPTLEDLFRKVPRPELLRLRRLFGYALRSGKNGETVFRYSQGDGTERWLSVRFSVVANGGISNATAVAVVQDVTAAKTRELALQKGDMIKSAILETAVDAMVTVDAVGRVVGWNQAAELLFGFPRDVAIGQDLVELVYPPAEVEARRHGLRQVLAGLLPGSGRQINVEMVKADGTKARCEMAIRSIEVEGRHHFTAFIRDISDRVDPEIDPDSKFSDPMLRTMADLCPGPVWVAYADGYVTYLNEHWRAFTGRTLENSLPVGWLESFHPDDVAGHLMTWAECIRNGTAAATDVRILRHDGIYRWCEIKVQPQFDRKGNLVAWIGSSSDVTTRRDLEEVLREQRDKLWNMSSDLIGVYRADGTIIAFNPAWTSLLGIPPEDMELSNFSSWLRLDNVKRATVSPSIRMGEGAFLFDARVAARDGTDKLVSWTVVPHDGLYYAVGRDLTAEREAADALRRSEDALRQSQKLEAIGQLTGGIAHDLNNTLQGVVGGLSVVSKKIETGEPESARKALDMANRSARKASGFIDRLLLFARRKTLEIGATDIGALVASLKELVSATVGGKIEVTVEVAPDLPQAISDVDQLESAIVNLVINARDAMPAGGKLKIGVEAVSDASPADGMPRSSWVTLSVSDSGTGMRQEEVERAFEPFYTTKPIGQGTGLGLSMVYGFLKQVGGHVDIRSELGVGTTVTAWFPVQGGAADPAPVPHPQDLAESKPHTLLVEPDYDVALAASAVLEDLGCSVSLVASAEEALPVLQGGEAFDLLLTADTLPGMNGRQLAEIARQDRPDLLVMFASAYDNSPVLSGDLAAGMVVVRKPIGQSGVTSALAGLLPPYKMVS